MHCTKRILLGLPLLRVLSTLASPAATQNVSWSPCPNLNIGVDKLQCAEIQAPLDYDHPEKGFITLGLSKLPASDTSKRIGPLFLNPGGPGNIATDAIGLGVATGLIPKEMREHFDIIGVDVRGTGRSNPIVCQSDTFRPVVGTFLSDPTIYENMVQDNLKFRQNCNSTLVDYIDTITVAKDHEHVRCALGGEQVTFFGISYGTALVAQYGRLFPHALRAGLLDAVLDDSQPNMALLLESGAAQESALRYFFQWCKNQTATDCPLAHHNQTLEQVWDTIIKRVPQDQHARLRDYTYRQFYTPILQYQELAKSLSSIAFDNKTLPSETLPELDTIYKASSNYVGRLMPCNDHASPDLPSQWADKQRIIQAQAPLLQAASSTLLFLTTCAGLPRPKRPLEKIHMPPTQAKFLLVTTLYDPATTTSWANTVQEQLGIERTALIQRTKDGHATFIDPRAQGGRTLNAMVDFLVRLEMPPDGTVFDN